MFGTAPSMSVQKGGTSIIVLAPALPHSCCVILGKCLPLSGPESSHASCSFWVITKKPEIGVRVEVGGGERSQRCWERRDLETNNGLSSHLGNLSPPKFLLQGFRFIQLRILCGSNSYIIY